MSERVILISEGLASRALTGACHNAAVILTTGAPQESEWPCIEQMKTDYATILASTPPHRNDRAYLKRKKGRA